MCGWHLGDDYCKAAPIAWKTGDDVAMVELPIGLTDVGTPSVFRWTRNARGRPSPVAASGRIVPAPCLVPCGKDHLSRIDSSLALP